MQFKSVLTLFALLLPALSNAGQGGSAGARGGGSGVLCAGNTAPITIEQSTLKTLNRADAIPENRAEILPWLKTKLNFAPEVYAGLERNWNKIGEYNSWKTSTEHDFAYLLSINTGIRLHTNSIAPIQNFRIPLQSILAGVMLEDFNQPDRVLSPGNSRHLVIGDDDYVSPQGCEKVQLSFIFGTEIYKISDFTISEKTKRFLELHEAVYLYAIELGYSFPTRVRDFITGILSPVENDVMKAANLLQPIEAGTLPFSNFNGFGIYLANPGEPEACPYAIAFVQDQKLLRASTLFRGSEQSRRVRFLTATRQVLANGHSEAVLEPEEDSASENVLLEKTDDRHVQLETTGTSCHFTVPEAVHFNSENGQTEYKLWNSMLLNIFDGP